MFKCRHKRFGKVEEGFQYCLKCGWARRLPCSHKWVRENIVKVMGNFGYVFYFEALDRCEICGEVKIYKIGNGQ